MAVKQISKICIKKGSINYLPDSLDEAEMCFTTDTGEVFIGAPNFGPVQYRSSSTGNSSKLPFRNIKLLTEFDAVKSITGDVYFQGPLVNVTFPISETAIDLYTFTEGNTIIVSYSLFDGLNVNVVGEIYISTYNGVVTACVSGQRAIGIIFSGYINDNNQVVLQGINTTQSIYTLYMSAKCWNSSLASWEGNKGTGIGPICAGDGTDGDEYLSGLKDVKLTDLSDKNFLQYNATDKMWENITINYSDITGTPPSTPVAIAECTDVKLTDLTGDQVLQYNSTDKMWENISASFPATWTLDKNITAAGSTYDDATPTKSTLVQVTSSEGFTDTIIAGTSTPSNYYHYVGTYLTSAAAPTITSTQVYPTGGSGTGAELLQQNSEISVELAKSTSSIFSQTFSISILGTYWQIYSAIFEPYDASSYRWEYNSQNVYYQVTGIAPVSGSTTTYNVTELTPVYKDNSGNYNKITTSDIPNVNGKIYSAPNSAMKLFQVGTSVTQYSTGMADIYPNNAFVSNGFMLFEYATGWSGDSTNNVNWGGQNYAVGDVLTCGLDGTFTVTNVSTVPNRGIRLSDQTIGSMVIVKNETSNKPINVYGFNSTDSINGSSTYTIPDSTYKNYETKFIKTDSTSWQVF